MARFADNDGRRLTRRGVLLGAGGAALGLAAAGGVLLGGDAQAADAYTALRDRWRDILTGRSNLDPARPEFQNALAKLDRGVDAARAVIDRGTGRTRVFTDMPLKQTTDSGMVSGTYKRLRTLAIAWATPGSQYHDSDAVLTDVLAGLKTANDIVYRAGRTEFDNWWDWEIGSSRPLADCLVLLDEELDATTRERYASAIRHFVPDPWYMYIDSRKKLSTGANRVDLCQAALVQGIASRSSARIQRAADGLPVTCAYVSSGDGLYADGSFIQHGNVAYTGTYGAVLLSGLAKLVELLSGSTWALTDPVMQNLYDAVERAWAPVIHDGRMLSFVSGRAISRSNATEQALATDVMWSILQLARADVVDEATARRWRGMCRGWMDRATGRNPYTGADVARTALVSALLDDSSVTPAPEPRSSVVFRNMGRSVHRRPGWAFAVSMCSNRIARYEYMNGENPKGFHTGAGMTYLYDDDNTQYSDSFWPTVDPYRLPGTTVERRTLADGAGRTLPTSKWAGGPVLGAYSAPGMTLQGATTNLHAKKSWFCFDEYVFAMGHDIRGGSGYAVDTIVENRNLHASGTNKLLVDGVEWVSGQNTSRTWTDASWAHLDGVAGYVFPSATPPRLRADRTERTGTWRAINTGGSTTPITRRYLGLTIEHGANPSGVGYMYLLIPKATPERTAQLAANRDVSIVSYNATCHAVRQSATGITMANFWKAPNTRGGITVDKVCGVITQELDDKLTIAVAEPVRSGNKIRVTVTPRLSGYQLARKDSQVTVVSVGTSIVLDVSPGSYGRTFYAEFTRTS